MGLSGDEYFLWAELLCRVTAEAPSATGLELSDEFMHRGCTKEHKLRAAFEWAMVALPCMGYRIVPDCEAEKPA